jgi:resolvase, N-terminal domain protein
MKQLMFSSKIKLGSNTENTHNGIRLTHLIRPLQKSLVNDTKQEEHYLKENSAIYKLPVNLTKLDKVLSSDRVYSNHALSWHLKSLCLGLVFAFSLTSAMKSLHLTIVILKQNKKGETMTGQRIAYIRVSAVDQNLESQKKLLQKCEISKWFEEKISGKNTDRPQLQAMLEYVREGDTVYVKDLSRLARNTKDLLDIVEYLTNKGVALKSLKESIDTSSNFGKLMITFLAAIYEFERANLLERQKDGIAVAKQKGKYKGRKKVDKPANFSEVYQKWLNRQIKSVTAIRELNISEYAFYKFVREENANG